MRIKFPAPKKDFETLKKIVEARGEARRRAYEAERKRIGLYDEDAHWTSGGFEEDFGYTPGDQ